MKTRPEFKKEAYEAARILCEKGMGGVVIAFDYRIRSLGTTEDSKSKYGADFFNLPADTIVQSVLSGELPLE